MKKINKIMEKKNSLVLLFDLAWEPVSLSFLLEALRAMFLFTSGVLKLILRPAGGRKELK